MLCIKWALHAGGRISCTPRDVLPNWQKHHVSFYPWNCPICDFSEQEIFPGWQKRSTSSKSRQALWFWRYGTDCNGNSWVVENELEQFWTVFKTALHNRIFEWNCTNRMASIPIWRITLRLSFLHVTPDSLQRLTKIHSFAATNAPYIFPLHPRISTARYIA